MVWIDTALAGASILSTVIATLRAGSRGVYLLNHDSIGIMNGPQIQRPVGNETNPLFDLSEAFRHCVRLSIAPQYYENVTFQRPVQQIVEPYPLYPQPYKVIKRETESSSSSSSSKKITTVTTLSNNQRAAETITTTILDTNNTVTTNQITDDDDESSNNSTTKYSHIAKRLAYAMNPLNGARHVAGYIQEGVQQGIQQSLPYIELTRRAPQYVALTPKIASYYVQTAWRKRRKKKKSVDQKDSQTNYDDSSSSSSTTTRDEWDHNFSTKAQLRFKSNDGTARIAELNVFAPNSFEHLRSIFGISEESYRRSIFASGPFVSFQSNSKGAARAGGVFFFTRDGAYMIKTIKKDEAKTFLKMLPKYHNHMKRHGRTSLLTRFCGMYGVRIYDQGSPDHGQLHTFVVMNAVFPAEASSFVTERFDLKGSTVGREVSEEELNSKGSNAVLKDLDLAREVSLVRSMERNTKDSVARHGFHLGVSAKAALLSQLREDVKLLVDCQVMDYSLLVGVVDMEGSHKNDKYVQQALLTMRAQETQFERLEGPSSMTRKKKSLDEKALAAIAAPIRLLLAPPVFVARRTWSFARLTLSSIVTLPLPYYGAGNCGVNGGLYSIMNGKRRGDRAVYYLGLIDFLQPWTFRKVVERKLKGLIGQDTKAISCVDPEEYANRFLEFLDSHIS